MSNNPSLSTLLKQFVDAYDEYREAVAVETQALFKKRAIEEILINILGEGTYIYQGLLFDVPEDNGNPIVVKDHTALSPGIIEQLEEEQLAKLDPNKDPF